MIEFALLDFALDGSSVSLHGSSALHENEIPSLALLTMSLGSIPFGRKGIRLGSRCRYVKASLNYHEPQR